MPVKQHFVRYLDLIQHRPPHLRKRTCLGTIRTTANQWTLQPHCSRRCCLIRKAFSMDRGEVRCHCYLSSIYFTGIGFLSVLFVALLFTASLLSLLACILICVVTVLLLPLCRFNAIVHVIRLVLWHLHTYKSGAISFRMMAVCFLSGNRSCSLANTSPQLGCRPGHGRALRGLEPHSTSTW